MKAVKVNFAGQDFYMAMTAEAMFEIKDAFGETSILFEKIQPETKEARECLYQAVEILMRSAELARRDMGYAKGLCLSASELRTMASVDEISMLMIAVLDAIELGYNREIQDPEKEVDLVLQELEKKR
jgi:hypothetical protein